PLTPALADRLSGAPLILLLDIDGTLAPIAARPDEAGVPAETREVLDALSKTPSVILVAVSGRAVDDARRVLDVEHAWVIGNHGAELGEPGRPATARADVAPFADAVATAVRRATESLASYRGVIVEDKRWTLSIHYRLARRNVVPSVIAKATDIANALHLRVTLGKEVIELRPPVDVHKGSASIELIERFGALHDGASLLCAGDDRTDEDMFRSVRARDPRAVTVHVTGHLDGAETAAEFVVADPTAVRELLRATLALRE
ncbi:MAG TPA: trehalose-phosphatase, partial [Gemmatimonadaceae bacterium]